MVVLLILQHGKSFLHLVLSKDLALDHVIGLCLVNFELRGLLRLHDEGQWHEDEFMLQAVHDQSVNEDLLADDVLFIPDVVCEKIRS